jgi:hypothetical protein
MQAQSFPRNFRMGTQILAPLEQFYHCGKSAFWAQHQLN